MACFEGFISRSQRKFHESQPEFPNQLQHQFRHGFRFEFQEIPGEKNDGKSGLYAFYGYSFYYWFLV